MAEKIDLVGQFTDGDDVLHYPDDGSQDVDQVAWLAIDLDQRVKFNFGTRTWHIWDPVASAWRPDKVDTVEGMVIAMAKRRAMWMVDKGKEWDAPLKKLRKLFDIYRVNTALETLATSADYSTDGSEWDTEPYLLGCPNGIVDLRTGQFLTDPYIGADGKQHRLHEAGVTKTTGVPFDPDAQCDGFKAFLAQITSDEPEVAAFLIQWFGYSLFGRNWEQRFLVLTGEGGNGKGVLCGLTRRVLGEYDADSNQHIYMKSRFGSARSSEARPDLMCLKGARTAIMSEPEGGAFNEELLKAHTGGDPIVARPLYGKEQRWDPTHTPTFLTNHPPSLDDVGPAMARRILSVDFREKFDNHDADHRKDPALEDRLFAKEGMGILALLVQAAAEYWQRYQAGEGLVLPARVARNSQAYLDRNDPIGRAVEEAFVIEKGARTSSTDLYRAYLDWHATSDDPNEALSQHAFALLMQRRGFPRRRERVGTLYIGVRPKSAMELAVDDDAA